MTNIPTPYRNPVYELVGVEDDLDAQVLFCSPSEPNRHWKFDKLSFEHVFLSKQQKGYKHVNFRVFKQLNRTNPDVVITAGFTPTMLFSFVWTIIRGKKHITFSDGTIDSEAGLSKLHVLIRKLVFKKTHAFLAAGNKTVELFTRYGVNRDDIFKSVLAINNASFEKKSIEREYHLMFSGRIEPVKNPLFFVKVSKLVKKEIPDLKVLILGKGSLENELIDQFTDAGIAFDYKGFLSQEELPNAYNSSKLFLFPTLSDPWGLVANEAMAASMPVVVSPHAGVADDLVVDGKNGLVLPLKEEIWAYKIIELLREEKDWKKLGDQAGIDVQAFTHSAASRGIVDACKYVFAKKT